MNIHKLFPSQWLSPADLGTRQFELIIESVAMATVRNTQTNQDEQKPAIKFAKAQKRLLMNKTQAFAIAAITGEDDTDKWSGHAIVLAAGIARNRKPTIVVSAPASKPPVAEIPADDDNPFEPADDHDAE